MADLDDKIPGLESADVVTKYKTAGDMASKVIDQVVAACVAGAVTIDICKLGDKLIGEGTDAVYNNKDKTTGKVVAKGVAFPTCVSVNNCICHNSPIESCKEIILAEGDLVKIDLGIHIDGFIAPVATTIVVGGGMVTGKQADVIACAWTAAEVALRMMRPGAKTYAVTDAIEKIVKAFDCKAVEGMLSHQLTKNKIDGEKAVILAPTEALRKEHKDATIEANEVYALDVIVSSGEGKPREGEQRTTVFKKTENTYRLKMSASRSVFSEVSKKFSVMPFTLRAMDDEKTARLGVTECVKHEILEPFKIMWEREGEFVAQFKILCLVLPNGNLRGTTTSTFDINTIKSEKNLEGVEGGAELISLLKTTVSSKSKKKKKKAKKTEEDAAPKEDGGDK